jgi:hypothetical protein
MWYIQLPVSVNAECTDNDIFSKLIVCDNMALILYLWLWAVILYFLYFYDVWSMNYVWRWKLCCCYQALDVLNYEHGILYIHMYEPYSCAIKFILFIICQLLIIAYIIIYIYIYVPVQSICGRFDLSGPKQLNRRFNRFETVGPVNQWTDDLAGSISGPVLITLVKTSLYMYL